MATTRTASTHWEGTLMEGAGKVSMDSSGLGAFDLTWASRANEPAGRTSPEELIAMAHSGCFSMALSSALAKAGTPAQTLDTRAEVSRAATGKPLPSALAVVSMSGMTP